MRKRAQGFGSSICFLEDRPLRARSLVGQREQRQFCIGIRLPYNFPGLENGDQSKWQKRQRQKHENAERKAAKNVSVEKAASHITTS